MDWEFFIVQTLSGISFAAILFLLASGLSLIFGVMNIVNIAHGSYYMLGGYIYRHNRIRDAAFLPSKIF
jgi:branched-subunit amino acid ABC-type transport system permease component